MIDDALRDGHRLIGMIQPDPRACRARRQAAAVQDRLRRPHHPARRKRRRPLSARAHRRGALPHRGGTARSPPPIASAASPTRRSPTTSSRARARTRSTARRCCARCAAFMKANNLKADWEDIEKAPNEALVNALAMMSPYGPAGEAGAAGGARPEDPRRNPGRHHRDRARQEEHRGRAAVAVADRAAAMLVSIAVANSPGAAVHAHRPPTTERPAGSVDPKLLEILVCPLTKSHAGIRRRQAGADLAQGQARLSDPRRHSDHAAGRGAAAGVELDPTSSCRLIRASSLRRCNHDGMAGTSPAMTDK